MDRSAFLHIAAGGALVAATSLAEAGPADADDNTYYGLVLNGAKNLAISYDNNNVLLVRNFRRSPNAAGKPESYIKNVPPGTAAFPDRPLRANEPLVLRQVMSVADARIALPRLRQNGGYWYFYVKNTGKGYFDVLKSRIAYASVKID